MAEPDYPIALIPAHNEEATVGIIVAQVRELWNYPVVVIDDCSSDATAQAARNAGATVLPLTLQLGAWGAIQTGLRYALRQGYRTAITLDAKQHKGTVELAFHTLSELKGLLDKLDHQIQTDTLLRGQISLSVDNSREANALLLELGANRDPELT